MRWRITLTSLLTLSLLAFPAYYAGDDKAAWGSYTAAFVFLLGLSQFGLAFVALMQLCGASWARAFFHTALSASWCALPMAMFGFLLLLPGRAAVLVWLQDDGHKIWLSEPALWTRIVLSQALFYSLCWRSWTTWNAHSASSAKQLTQLSPWILIAFVLANSILAWDFGMLLYPHWHSSIYPIQHWFGSVLGGAALLLLLQQDPRPDEAQQLAMAQLLQGFALIWLYLFWAQYLVSWFGNLPHETGPLRAQMEGEFAGLFWMGFGGLFALPFFALLFAHIRRDRERLLLIALLIVAALGLQRYVTVMAALVPGPGAWMPLLWSLGGLSACWSLGHLLWREPQSGIVATQASTGAETT